MDVYRSPPPDPGGHAWRLTHRGSALEVCERACGARRMFGDTERPIYFTGPSGRDVVMAEIDPGCVAQAAK